MRLASLLNYEDVQQYYSFVSLGMYVKLYASSHFLLETNLKMSEAAYPFTLHAVMFCTGTISFLNLQTFRCSAALMIQRSYLKVSLKYIEYGSRIFIRNVSI
jgi:hypothetical protein